MISKKTISRYKTLRTAWPVGVCLLLLFHSALLHAQVIPGRWEKVEAQKQGTELTLILHSGEQVYGLLEEVTTDTVIVIEEGGGQRSITKLSVHHVETTRIDSTRNRWSNWQYRRRPRCRCHFKFPEGFGLPTRRPHLRGLRCGFRCGHWLRGGKVC